jgi:hypothetical protein
MAIGLKLRDVKRFGQKVQKGVSTFGRKLAKTAEQVGGAVAPIATLVGGPEAGLAVEGATTAVSKFGRGLEKASGKGIAKGTELFKKAQQPILGAQEIGRAIKGINPKNIDATKMRIGDVAVKRFGAKGIQRGEPGQEMMMMNE